MTTAAHTPRVGVLGLGGILRELDPEARPLPLLLPAVTDARHFARLRIQTYGFLPMRLPADLRFMELIHAEDERIPVDALDFGTQAIQRLIENPLARSLLEGRFPPGSTITIDADPVGGTLLFSSGGETVVTDAASRRDVHVAGEAVGAGLRPGLTDLPSTEPAAGDRTERLN